MEQPDNFSEFDKDLQFQSARQKTVLFNKKFLRFALLPFAVANIGLLLFIQKGASRDLLMDFFMGILIFGVCYPVMGFLLGFALAIIPYKDLTYAQKYMTCSMAAIGIFEALTLCVLAFEAIDSY